MSEAKTCCHCGKKFRKQSELVRHQKTAKYCLKMQGEIPKGELICEFCGHDFHRQSDLIKHKKTAKSCLKIQGKLPNVEIESERGSIDSDTEFLACKGCGKEYSRSDNLKRHEAKCIKVKEIDLKADILSIVDKKLEGLKPITPEHIEGYLDHLSLSFIEGGGLGFANYANVYPFKGGMVVCTDRSRRKFKYKIEDETYNDYGSKLAQTFFKTVVIKSEELINQKYELLQQDIERIANGGTSDYSLSEMLSRAAQLQETLYLCTQAANGDHNILTESFVKHLSKML